MIKNTLFTVFSLLPVVIWSQITFVVNQLPEDHDFSKPIYVSGDFEGWTGGHEDYKLTQIDDGYTITLPLKDELIAYKFTQGSWDLVEYDANGNQIDNRTTNVGNEPITVEVAIASWTKASEDTKPTASKNVSIISENFTIPQLNRQRRIWIYLPPDYNVSNQSYPVLYMHDGQNLFDKQTSFSEEWEVDETLDRLYDDKNLKLIVVGVDNGGDSRLNEYSPWTHPKYGIGEGDKYVDFITQTLKPYIDKNFRTLKDADNTGIMGSSMGGLISHYAGLKYPDVFGKVGVFSPSFWYANQSFEFAKEQSKSSNQNMYFLVGGEEGYNMVPDLDKMVNLMQKQGFKKENIYKKISDGGEHNEGFWKSEFEEAILWLFQPSIKPTRIFKSAQFQDGEFLNVKVSDGNYKIRFYDSEIVETTFIPTGETVNKQSHAVVLEPSKVDINLEERDDIIIFSSDDFEVRVQKSPFKISYWYDGEEVISEKNGYRKTNDFETLQFNLTDDEVLYGGGARALGMNRRGNRLQLYNRAHYGYETHSELMNFTIPLVLSSKQYMVHFDNAPIGYLDLDSKKDNTLTYETISGRKTYQVVVGNSWYDLIDNYTDLTGKQPMPPRWALGNFSSRFGYHSQAETEATVQKFKDEQIPVDAVILDLYWFGKKLKGTMGNLEWYRDSFPNPQKMIKDLKQKGVKTVLITEPFVLTTSNRWDEAVQNNVLAKDTLGNPATYDFYFGNTGIIDVYNPKGKSWFWNIYKDLANQGVAGFWGDLGEPEVHPSLVQHATGTADEVHNTYGHDWARLVYEGYAKDFPNQRPFILMRAGYSGSQHYGMIPWSGDVNRTWGGLQSQPEIALQMGLQGMAYMHSDLGGFAGANLDDELYTRWLQYGVFQPIYRPHAQEEVPSEPVFREEKTKQLAKQSIELRYKLLPYNYNLAFENSQYGKPLMRPLFFDETNNKMLQEDDTAYLWGSDFLIAPIKSSEEEAITFYLTSCSNWFNFYTDEFHKGGKPVIEKTYQDYIPTYVRAGAFIPMAKVVQSTDDYAFNNFDLHYYFDESVEESEREFYNDDGLTKNAHEKGMYEILEFEYEKERRWHEFDFEAELGENYQPETKSFNLIIHNVEKNPKRVKLDSKKIKEFKYNNTDRTLTIPVTWHTEKEIELKIKY